MRRFGLLATASLITHGALAASAPCPTGAPNSAASNGGFGAIGNQWYSPNGQPWTPHGINVMDFGNAPAASQILSAFPGTNFVRLAVYNFPDPASLQAIVSDYTSHGIFTELDQHSSNDGQNRGGGTGTIFTGSSLQQDLAWFSSAGAAFKTNPYVGFGSTNEPSDINPATGQSDPAALSAWQRAEYDALRQSGNNNPLWLEANCWPTVCNQGYSSANYAGMTNVAWDMHVYPWMFPTGNGASQDQSMIGQFAASAQQTANIPVNILEYGDSTVGVTIDPNGQQSVQAVESSGLGGAAWAWGTGGAGGGDGLQNNSTPYPAMVAASIAAGGGTGCPQSPVATPDMTPPTQDQITAAQQAVAPMIAADFGTGTGSTTAATLPAGITPPNLPTVPPPPFPQPTTQATAPVLAMPPVTASPLAPASTGQTAPSLAPNPMSIPQVAALALKGALWWK